MRQTRSPVFLRNLRALRFRAGLAAPATARGQCPAGVRWRPACVPTSGAVPVAVGFLWRPRREDGPSAPRSFRVLDVLFLCPLTSMDFFLASSRSCTRACSRLELGVEFCLRGAGSACWSFVGESGFPFPRACLLWLFSGGVSGFDGRKALASQVGGKVLLPLFFGWAFV